ncbi:MAG: hypothetical protein RMK29_02690 [Myxococcales bacterium]|nr:hypothetical protein [Myxococcales bacterium]
MTGSPELRAEVEIHDRQQIEVELAYPLLRDRTSVYVTELLLFVPRNVGVSSHNYSRDNFYADLTAYLRLDSPRLSLSELADLSCERSPLHHLARALSALEADLQARLPQPILVLIKLFGHSFREAVVAARQALQQQIAEAAAARGSQRAAARAALLASLQDMAQNGHVALRRFRALRRRFQPLSGARPQVVRETFEYVDENATSFLVEQMAEVASDLGRQAALHDGSGMVAAALCTLHREAREIAAGRRAEGFVYPNPAQQRTAEFFTYRRGQIKKSMQQAFYLETRALRRDPYVRNAIAMVAAGLAAIWSLVAQVPATLGGLSSETQFLFLASAVVAYMLKDRIKDLTKEYLGQRLRHYDHDNRILADNLSVVGLKGISGRARERMRWTTPAQLPERLRHLRAHPRTVAGSDISSEEVIDYIRTLMLSPEPGSELPPGFALRDILRLNLQRFMLRLDEPLDEVSYFDLRRQRFLRVQTPKVYHVNLLLRVCAGLERSREVLLARYRIVLNKERILRIEKVALHRRTGDQSP